MISTFPFIFPSSDSLLGNPFPSFDGGFTPWDCPEDFPAAVHTPNPGSDDPVLSPNPVLSGSVEPVYSPNPIQSGSGSDEPNGNLADSKPGPDEPDPAVPVSVAEERKRRRMISNRESARRSRMRKQKHVENLRNQANRLRVDNRELANRLRLAMYHLHRVRSDNSRLISELTALRHKLNDIRQLLLFRRLQQQFPSWPCNTVAFEQTTSLIT